MTIKLLSLVLSTVALFSCDASSGPASNEMSTTSVVPAAQSFANSNRMIRAPNEQDSTFEERFMNQPTTLKLTDALKKWIKEKLASMTSNLRKFVESMRLSKQDKIDRKIEKAKRLIQEEAAIQTLRKNKITPDEYFKALGLDESLRGLPNTIENREKYPDLAKWHDYTEHYKSHTLHMTEILNHIKRKIGLAE
ncbi:hypothetical protein PsorP6_014710 [Peronosclerospora sorghi]|uniref:Uncharacterized protein n=1 Tax=Peronosclerospora sorghi TaxID=230839 RepID=A0ACC0VV93_9STRA|nr:hypothetical protein PsorP6_014710 [Peronosclerospora sorghi]